MHLLPAAMACVLPVASQAGDFAGIPLQEALEILRQRGLPVVYSSALVHPGMYVAEEPSAQAPRAILDEILAPHGLVVTSGPNGVLILTRSASPPAGAPPGLPGAPAEPVRAELGELVISASHYRLETDGVTRATLIDAQDIGLLPDLADDPLRSVARLPGIAVQDYTSKPHVRGGVADETLYRFDGLRLYDPFHLKDFQSLVSTIDPAVISRLSVYTAGFPSAFGDRMSGVIDIDRLRPTRPLQGQAFASFFNVGGHLAGLSADRGWDWLLAARRGTLDVALAAVDRDLGRPRYWDAYARIGRRLGERWALSGNLLVSRDDLEVFDQDQEEEATASYTDRYAWLRLDYDAGDGSGGHLLAARTRLDAGRRGSADLPGVGRGRLEDDRAFTIDSLQVEGWREIGSRARLQAGLEWRGMRGRYDYVDEAEFDLLFLVPGAPDAPARTRAVSVRPEGAQAGAFVNLRLEPLASLVADLGLRWDRETLSERGSDDLSPRIGLLWSVGEDTRIRLGWGRFAQAQSIDELPASDGETRFFPAQRAEHLVVGMEHRPVSWLQLRLEAYQKSYTRLRPRYENLFDTLVVLPELKPDRAVILPSEATAYGAEAMLEFDFQRGISGWLSYSWSRARDELGETEVPRNWDQSGYLSAGASWRGASWDLSLALTWRDGWPTTEVELAATDPVPLVAAGPRNANRLGAYARLDARVARRFEFDSAGLLTVFLEVTNLTDRRNQCCVDYQIEDEGEGPFLDIGTRQTVPFIPSLGFTWDF